MQGLGFRVCVCTVTNGAGAGFRMHGLGYGTGVGRLGVRDQGFLSARQVLVFRV